MRASGWRAESSVACGFAGGLSVVDISPGHQGLVAGGRKGQLTAPHHCPARKSQKKPGSNSHHGLRAVDARLMIDTANDWHSADLMQAARGTPGTQVWKGVRLVLIRMTGRARAVTHARKCRVIDRGRKQEGLGQGKDSDR